jgi:lysozyme
MTCEVIDLSANNGSVDFAAVKAAGVSLVILKATEGVDYVDPLFRQNVMRAQHADIMVLAYHYLRIRHGKPQDASTQVQQFSDLVRPLGIAGPLIVDVERAENEVASATEAQIAIWDACVECSCLYTSPGEWATFGGPTMKSMGDVDLWEADYGGAPVPLAPFGMPKLWQWSGNGSCPGVTTAVDRSRWLGTLDELIAWVNG